MPLKLKTFLNKVLQKTLQLLKRLKPKEKEITYKDLSQQVMKNMYRFLDTNKMPTREEIESFETMSNWIVELDKKVKKD